MGEEFRGLRPGIGGELQPESKRISLKLLAVVLNKRRFYDVENVKNQKTLAHKLSTQVNQSLKADRL